MFLSAETVSETINFAHLWTLILMLILLINDLNNSKNKINMNLQYVNTLSVDKPVFVNINIKILNTANLPSALLHHINTNLTVNSTDGKINMLLTFNISTACSLPLCLFLIRSTCNTLQ